MTNGSFRLKKLRSGKGHCLTVDAHGDSKSRSIEVLQILQTLLLCGHDVNDDDGDDDGDDGDEGTHDNDDNDDDHEDDVSSYKSNSFTRRK